MEAALRVRGRTDEVTPQDYAREVADLLAERLAQSLGQQQQDTELPTPVEFADSIEAIVVCVPEETPNELADLLGPFWTGARVREALGVPTRQALDSRRRNGSVLALKSTDGALFYPVAQFQRRPDGQIQVKPALVGLFRTLRGFDSWTVGVLLHTPAPELDGLTPLDWVGQGKDVGALEELGLAIAREWSTGAA